MKEECKSDDAPAKGAPIGNSVLQKTQMERLQGHGTRADLFTRLKEKLGRPVITFFTSFAYPVSIEDEDVDFLEGVLREADLTKGFALMISSPGGDGLAAERIVNLCRSYSGTGEFWTIVPSKAKSAATMICFGSSEIIMGPSSELGPVDPQLIVRDEEGQRKQFSAYNYVKSYDNLFARAVETEGNVQPFLQQLDRYDERDIEEFRSLLGLTDDYAVRTLKTGMMKEFSEDQIREKIAPFLEPVQKKVHGRPIFRHEAAECGLKIRLADENDSIWGDVYELYIRTDGLVSTRLCKCIESCTNSFTVSP